MSPCFPAALHGVAVVSLALAVFCAVTIALDEVRRPQKMAVMNAVWPLTALFGSVLWLALYYPIIAGVPGARMTGHRWRCRCAGAPATAARAVRWET